MQGSFLRVPSSSCIISLTSFKGYFLKKKQQRKQHPFLEFEKGGVQQQVEVELVMMVIAERKWGT